MGNSRIPGSVGIKSPHGGAGVTHGSGWGRAKGEGDPRPTGSAPAGGTSPPTAPVVRSVTFWRLMEQSLRTDLTRRIVTRIRGAAIQDLENFDWREFQIGGQACFRAVIPDARVQGLRTRMLRELTSTGLSRPLASNLMLPTRSRATEHATYIFQNGNLGRVVEGERYRVDDHAPATTTGLIGYCHTHPPSSQIRPPTIGDDFLESAIYPVQFMIEAHPARIWAIMSPNFACILGGLGNRGTFFRLEESAPQAAFVWAMTGR